LLNLSDEEKSRGVITTSAGNHAQALAYQGSKLGIPVTVVMPVQAPRVKVFIKCEAVLDVTCNSKGATRGGAKGTEPPPLARSKSRKKIKSFNF